MSILCISTIAISLFVENSLLTAVKVHKPSGSLNLRFGGSWEVGPLTTLVKKVLYKTLANSTYEKLILLVSYHNKRN